MGFFFTICLFWKEKDPISKLKNIKLGAGVCAFIPKISPSSHMLKRNWLPEGLMFCTRLPTYLLFRCLQYPTLVFLQWEMSWVVINSFRILCESSLQAPCTKRVCLRWLRCVYCAALEVWVASRSVIGQVLLLTLLLVHGTEHPIHSVIAFQQDGVSRCFAQWKASGVSAATNAFGKQSKLHWCSLGVLGSGPSKHRMFLKILHFSPKNAWKVSFGVCQAFNIPT